MKRNELLRQGIVVESTVWTSCMSYVNARTVGVTVDLDARLLDVPWLGGLGGVMARHCAAGRVKR